jgi:tetratricopeptide (TPR) repeat protein
MGSSDFELGLRLFRAGRLGEAAAACSRHLSARPGDPNALHLLGRVLLKGGRLPEAVATLEKAAEALPGDAQVLLALGSARREAGDAEAAKEAFQRATALAPGLGAAWFNLGLSLRDRGQEREAVLAFREAALIDSSDHVAAQNVVTTLEGAVLAGRTPFPPAAPRIARGANVPVSIVVCSIDPERLRKFRERMARHLEGREHEIIVIGDARSLCDGYRRGWERARHPIVVFSHDDFHILSERPFDAIESALAGADIVGLAGSTLAAGPAVLWAGHPHIHGWITHPAPDGNGLETAVISLASGTIAGMQALDGVFLAMHREVPGRVGFDEETFDGFHFYDLDFTLRAARAGFRLCVTTDIVAIHESRGNFDAVYEGYAERFRKKYPELSSTPRGFHYWYGARLQADAQVLALCEQLRALDAIKSPLDEARLSHRRGELDAAIEGYARALRDDPSRADVWHLKGLAEQQRGHAEAALASIARAIEVGGERPPFLMLKGQLLHDLGRLDEAEQSFARLAATRPDWPPAHVALGSARMDRGDFAGAAQAFQAAVQAEPKHARAWHNLGVALRSLGKAAEA